MSPSAPGSDGPPPLSRRRFLSGCAIAAGLPLVVRGGPPPIPGLSGQVGITTSSLFRQTAGKAADRNFELWDIPRILRDELDMKVIDLSTGTLGSSHDPARLERLRTAAADAGCVITNLERDASWRQSARPALRSPRSGNPPRRDQRI